MRRLLLATGLVAIAFGCSQDSPTSPMTSPAPVITNDSSRPDDAQVPDAQHEQLRRLLDSMARQHALTVQEDFNCTTVEEVRARFSDPGFVDGLDVGLFVKFVGIPAGTKTLRVWWDYEGDFGTFEDIDVGDGDVNPEDESKFDVEMVLEHSYRMSGAKRVRVELILDGSTGNCSRNRDVSVTAGVSYDHVATYAGRKACTVFGAPSMGIGVNFSPPLPPGTTYTVRARVDLPGFAGMPFILVGFRNAAGTDFFFTPFASTSIPATYSATFNTVGEHKTLLVAANTTAFTPSMTLHVVSIDIKGKTVLFDGPVGESCP